MCKNVVCCLTPPGISAIAVTGLRGATVWSKLAPYFTSKRAPQLTPQAQIYRGNLQDDKMGDEVVLSLQGDECVQIIEVQTHGGPGIVQWLINLAQQQLDCRLIQWDKWLNLSNNKLWVLLSSATTKKTASILLDQCQGAFARAVDRIRKQFQQEDADKQQLLQEVHRLQQWGSLGAHLVHPWRVVLAGPPNVGKSSLFNALLGFERAITSPHPGTTRDLVEATLAWKGYPIELIDTAGLRAAKDELEAEGVKRATQAFLEADMVLWLVDLSQEQPPHTSPLPRGGKAGVLLDEIKPTFLVGTKADLPRLSEVNVDYTVSATTGSGLNELLDGMLHHFVPIEPVPGQGIPITEQDKETLARLKEEIASKMPACETPPSR